MSTSLAALKRNFGTGSRELDAHLDKLTQAISGGVTVTSVIVQKTSSGTSSSSVTTSSSSTSSASNNDISLVTLGTTTFTKGDLVGVSDGKHVKAVAGSYRALMACTAISTPGATLSHVASGLAYVKVESGITVAPGDPAYLSETTAGCATNTEPEVGTQIIGAFMTTKSDGLAVVQLHIDMSVAISDASSSSSETTSSSSDEPTVTNTGTTTFVLGNLVSIHDGAHTLALAGTSRAISVCTGASSPGATLLSRSSGNAWVSVEDGVTVALGDPAYLSASTAGRSTNVAPDAIQVVGTYQSTKSNGLAIVQLHIDLSVQEKP